MKVPRDAFIAREKLTHYLLVPKLKDDKSGFLAQAGFTQNNPDALEAALRQLIAENDAILDRANEYGIFCQVRGRLHGPSGILSVVAIWLRPHVDGEFRFHHVEAGKVGKMRLELYQEVALTRDEPTENLRTGDVATLIDYVAHPAGGEEGAVLEVFNALGESIAVVTVPATSIAPLRADQVRTVRTVTRSI